MDQWIKIKRSIVLKLSMVLHICNSSTQKLRQEECCKLEASLGLGREILFINK